ncbi:putative uncharacterized protein YLR154W-F [Aspergillus awamori]|uniref:Uncharacterized protein n=1 Tax=Aspergillus awamori TaxID=105351 RepID=A0A401L356_ASPAW|nr:putative uncharacterized protein YLR154W-F [Aspergillus awamori]
MRTPKEPAFKFELLPLHSPLLRQSRLVSFPPLIDMLKFSGYPYLIRGQPGKNGWKTSAGAGQSYRACDKAPYARGSDAVPPLPFGPVPPERGTATQHTSRAWAAMTLGQACPPEYQGAQYCTLSDSVRVGVSGGHGPGGRGAPRRPTSGGPAEATGYNRHGWEVGPKGPALGNDPSAGSPTETLLRLLLPLNDRVDQLSGSGGSLPTLLSQSEGLTEPFNR